MVQLFMKAIVRAYDLMFLFKMAEFQVLHKIIWGFIETKRPNLKIPCWNPP